MKSGIALAKEFAAARRDWIGLALSVMAPVLLVAAYAAIGLDTRAESRTLDPRNALALVLVLAVWLAALTSASTALLGERATGTVERLRVTPHNPLRLVLAKGFVLGLVAFLQAGVAWLAASLLIPDQLQGAPWLWGWLALGSVGLAAMAVGLLVAAALPSATQISSAVTLVTLVAITMTGFLKPVEEMGRLAGIAQNVPFTLGYDGVRQVLGGLRPTRETLLLALQAGVLLAAAAGAYTWGSRRRN